MNRISGIIFVGLLILALWFSTAAANQTESAPLTSDLQNGYFTCFAVTDKPVMLKDAKWQGEAYDKGAASRPEIMLLAGMYLAGDFERDGSNDTAVLQAEGDGALFFERKQNVFLK